MKRIILNRTFKKCTHPNCIIVCVCIYIHIDSLQDKRFCIVSPEKH